MKLVIDNLLKENNLLGSLRSFVSIALTIGHQTLKYVFVLIVCQNSTNTLRLLCTSRFQFARKLLHHRRNSTLKGKWTLSYFIFFIMNAWCEFWCGLVLLVVFFNFSSFSSFNCKKKKETSRKFSLSQWWYFRQAKSYKFIVVVNEKRQVLTWEFLRRGVHHSVDIQIRVSKVTVIFTGNVTKNWFIIWLKAVLRKNIDSSLAKVDWAFLPCTVVIDVKKWW